MFSCKGVTSQASRRLTAHSTRPLDSNSFIVVFTDVVSKLIEDASLRRRIGANARRYVREAHAIEKSAKGYLNFIREIVAQRVRRRFVRRVSSEIALLGIKPTNENFLRGVSTEIARLTPTELFDAKDNL